MTDAVEVVVKRDREGSVRRRTPFVGAGVGAAVAVGVIVCVVGVIVGASSPSASGTSAARRVRCMSLFSSNLRREWMFRMALCKRF